MDAPTLKELTDFTLDAYVKLLKYLKQKFTIVPFCNIPSNGSPYLILRHDIDAALPEALRMAKIEKELNIRSTYFVLFSGNFYNVFEGNNVDIIKQIADLGHEIGLHYYPAQYDRYDQNPMKSLKLEIQMLEHLLNKKVYSIARHGPWDRDPFTRIKEYVNANHPYIRGDLFVHESDRTWTPLEGLTTLLTNPPKKVQLLTHPENWQEDKIDRVTLLERHFDDLDKKNTSIKEGIIEYFQTEKSVVQYDEQIKKNKTKKSLISKIAEEKKQNKLQQMREYYGGLFRYYLINTKLGWNSRKLNSQLTHPFKQLPDFDSKEAEIVNFTKSSRIKPLLIVSAYYASVSGGYRRIYKILKYAKQEGIDYVIVTDKESYNNYIEMFPNFKDVVSQYKTYILPRNPRTLKDCLSLAFSTSKIADKENVDLVVGSSEGHQHVWASFLLGKLFHKPWTFLFAGQREIFEPTSKTGNLNVFNVFKHINQKNSLKNRNILSKLISAVGLLAYLKIAEKSLVLTVSTSIDKEIKSLDNKVNFHVITPGNGVDLEKYDTNLDGVPIYDAVFFSRLIPEKGLFAIPEIGKLLVQRLPETKIAVAGITQDPDFVDAFRRTVRKYNLANNIVFLGQQNEDAVIDLVKSSKLTIYPSVSDSYGLVVLESLACDRPVVAYDIPAIKHNFGAVSAVLRSPVEDHESMANNILFLLNDSDYRTKISKEAKAHVAKCSWKSVVKAEKEAYFKVVEWFKTRA